ncbi:hypothetical protein ACFXPX_13710 [Kitasatospora sp. NPDC059146]|uniref:hypothetical protein n=1 Tax=Kitasatospora sp. NPDC059146 TaxID=3346741 RepID=UPI003689CA8C
MNGSYPVDGESPLAGLFLPVSELGFTGAAVLAGTCYGLAASLRWLPVRNRAPRLLKELIIRTAYMCTCWSAVSIAVTYAWEAVQ